MLSAKGYSRIGQGRIRGLRTCSINGLQIWRVVIVAKQQSTQELGFDPDALRAKYREERDKRLRSDGNEQYFEVRGDFSHYVDDPYLDEVI